MSERISTEAHPLDEGISTATLAGLDDRTNLRRDNESSLRRDNELAQADMQESNLEAHGLPRDSAAARSGSTITTADLAASTSNMATPGTRSQDQTAPLFPGDEAAEMHSRWDAVQVGFVDEPRHAVEQADALVAGAMKRLAEIFAEERARLEGQWDRGDSVSTEDLRLALRRYRSFFGRVLSV
jgi:hypothetical protein